MYVNCDMGESFGIWKMGNDEAIMPYLDMANIACGKHASDPLVMLKTVRLAKKYEVKVGAHPGYADLEGFGRRNIQLSDDELSALFIYQIGALKAICDCEQVALSYVKPHGALYNIMMKDDHVFEVLIQSMKALNLNIPMVTLAVPHYQHYQSMADQYQIDIIFEAFIDRAYDDEGYLVSRNIVGATHQDLSLVTQQAEQLIKEQSVMTLTGKNVPIKAQTICIHGDGPFSLPAAQLLSKLLGKRRADGY